MLLLALLLVTACGQQLYDQPVIGILTYPSNSSSPFSSYFDASCVTASSVFVRPKCCLTLPPGLSFFSAISVTAPSELVVANHNDQLLPTIIYDFLKLYFNLGFKLLFQLLDLRK